MRQLPIILIALLILAGCAAQASAHTAEAHARWQAAAPRHYLLRTREDVRGRICGQQVEIRDEQLVRILSNTCQHPNLWTVTWLFAFADPAGRAPDRCVQTSGTSCVCRASTEVEVEYDPALGFPRQIIARETWRADWQSLGYWRYAALHLGLPGCTPPVADPGRKVVVRELRVLP